MNILIALAAGLATGSLITWIVLGGKLAKLRGEVAANERVSAEKERLAAEKERSLNLGMQRLLEQVTNVTNAALKEREKELTEKNGQQMALLMKPMHDQLAEFQKAAEASRRTNGDLGVKIEDFFKVLQTTAGEFGRQAKSFTDALTGANKAQGNWGENILTTLLVRCGLKEGEHFMSQTGNDGRIADCQVFDPGGGKILVIDSKMSWTKYEEAYRLEDGPERKAAMKAHVASVRKHIDELAEVDYPNHLRPPKPGYSYIPLTAMFVPCDAALAAALGEDPGLVGYAADRHIALVSPLTLYGFMLLVSRAWSKYNADRNSEEIFKQAKLLVERVDKLFDHLGKMGECLGKAKDQYDWVLKLANAEAEGQCIKGPAMKIMKLGGRPEKGVKSSQLTDAIGEKI